VLGALATGRACTGLQCDSADRAARILRMTIAPRPVAITAKGGRRLYTLPVLVAFASTSGTSGTSGMSRTSLSVSFFVSTSQT